MRRPATLILLLFALLSGCSNPDAINLNKLQLTDLEGNKVSLSEYKGKTIFLNFWATWCRDCMKEMPSILEAKKAVKDNNYVFLFVSDEEVERVKGFEQSRQFGFNYLMLEGNLKTYGIFYIPQTYIIRDGKILHAATMTLNWATKENIALLKSLAG